MILSVIRVAMPTVPTPCLQYHRQFPCKKIIHLDTMPTVPTVYEHIANARARETYVHTVGTVGMRSKLLFLLKKSCLWLDRHRVGTGRHCFLKNKKVLPGWFGLYGFVARGFFAETALYRGF